MKAYCWTGVDSSGQPRDGNCHTLGECEAIQDSQPWTEFHFGSAPNELTEVFREALAENQVAQSWLYAWEDGEPTYAGARIIGILSPNETRAVDAVYIHMKMGGAEKRGGR